MGPSSPAEGGRSKEEEGSGIAAEAPDDSKRAGARPAPGREAPPVPERQVQAVPSRTLGPGPEWPLVAPAGSPAAGREPAAPAVVPGDLLASSAFAEPPPRSAMRPPFPSPGLPPPTKQATSACGSPRPL